MRHLIACLLVTCVFLCAAVLHAQWVDTAPVEGLQQHRPSDYAIISDQVITAAGQAPIQATIIVRDGLIQQVANDLELPVDLQVVDATGKFVYPGFIDSYSERDVDGFASAAGYWNDGITPNRSVLFGFSNKKETSEKWRKQGFVARLVAPKGGQIKGTSALITCGSDAAGSSIVKSDVALHVSLTTSRHDRSEAYPSSPMGAVALVRQAFYDADWYGRAWKASQANSTIAQPSRNDALVALAEWTTSGKPVVIDSSNERYLARADRLGNEFSLPVIVRGSGREYRRLTDVVRTGRAVIVPLNFPKAPTVNTLADAASATLQSLMHWDLAPENPARLAAAGVRISLTTQGLEKPSHFWKHLRTAIKRGLPEDVALAALTTTPAQLFDVANQLGSIQPGKAANFVIATGNLFTDKKAKIEETWIAGQRHKIIDGSRSNLNGIWTLKMLAPAQSAVNGEKVDRDSEAKMAESRSVTVRLTGKPGKHKGSIASGDEPKKNRTRIEKLRQSESRLSLLFDGEKLDQEGFVNISFVMVGPMEADASFQGRGTRPDGSPFQCTMKRTGDLDESEEEEESEDEDEDDDQEEEESDADDEDEATDDDEATGDEDTAAGDSGDELALFDVNYPLGAYGRDQIPDQAESLAFTGATVWTSGSQGKLENATVVIADGKIKSVGSDIEIPTGAQVVDLAGKHLSPGIIDCHSHIATDGGVNEGTQAITCEVRIGDFIEPNDISIYRQLAGGVTAVNVLHGSANPIGGQNQVIKMRWGANGEGAKFKQAPAGVKFALGENVKQSNWGDDHSSRYPQTRMGVDEIHIDAFQRAVAYRQQWSDWKTNPQGLPPRYDLELEALAEIVEGKRWIHCHSYRQSEILALMQTCDRFGITIGTFQHILEGYKLADEMAKRGIMGSSFSDWWAYKFEVYDAIPFNGALMHKAGVVVSFNSDDAELGRRLNTEAAKAMRYGGVNAEEALKFVTLNPAKQLRIDEYVGSIEVGKDADFVIWSAAPLSIYAVAEQTWIDGRPMFDLNEDRQLQARDKRRHAALVQKVIKSGAEQRKPGEDDKNDDDLWAQADTYCHGHGHGHGE